MNKYLQSFLVLLFVFISGTLAAQVPSDYYANAEGKRGAELKSALFEIIKNPQVVSYADLWEVFQLTDSKRNNKVWDIYSDNPENGTDYSFDFIKHRCGSYRKEGDCYNREHTLPKSWYKKSGKLDSDLFHLYPTVM
jgi:endonuclease I